jgi:SAM-dependent methyltransferase
VLQSAARLIADAAALQPSMDPRRLLDLGTGTGRFARYLVPSGASVVGVDVSTEMLGHAATIHRPPYLVRGDARRLPFRSNSFDAALVVHLFHLIADWKAVVGELRRVLLPGAPLFIGSEAGKHFAVRALYFQVAGEWHITRPNLGAASLDAILEHLAESGARIERIDAGQLGWTARATVREMLETLRTNPYTHLWHIQAEEHALLMAEVERRAANVLPSPDYLEETPASLTLWKAAWP